MLVYGRARRLNDEYVRAPHAFRYLGEYLAVAETPQLRLPERNVQVFADSLRQGHVRSPAENLCIVHLSSHETKRA